VGKGKRKRGQGKYDVKEQLQGRNAKKVDRRKLKKKKEGGPR